MLDLILYSKKDCPNCNIAKVKLYRSGIEYQEKTIEPNDLELLKQKYGFVGRTLPIFEINGEGAYTYDKLDEVIDKLSNQG